MTDDKIIKDKIRESILEYIQEQLKQGKSGSTTPLSLRITETCIENKAEESAQKGILVETEEGPRFVKGHEPLLNENYRILSIDEHWTEDEWWQNCDNPPAIIDVALSLAAEYIHSKGTEAPLVFDNRKLAILYYLPKLQAEPEEDFCQRLTDLLYNLNQA